MKIVRRVVLSVIVVSICFVVGWMIAHKRNDRSIFQIKELSQYQLTIADKDIVDKLVIEDVLSFCENTHPYLQRTRYESGPKAGEQLNVENSFCFRHWVSESEYIKYFFWFFEAESQLAIDYIHRDAPLIEVQIIEGKTMQTYLGETYDMDDPQEIWYCQVSAADYAEMLNLIREYVE